MRFIVTQTGARRGYAVPLLLEKAGVLERFYTDLAGNVGLGKWFVKFGPLLGYRKLAAKLRARRVPDSIKDRTVTFGGLTLWFECNRAFRAPDPAAQFRTQLHWSRALGSAMARRGFGNATHLYSMLGECGPVLKSARRHGLTTVTEIYILLSAEKILAQEHRQFPQWEQQIPNLDLVRSEFGEQKTLLSDTDFAVCPSENVRRDLEENFSFCNAKCVVVPYGIDRNWLSQPNHPIPGRVLFVGTAGLRKGIHYLVAAAELLYGRGRPYQFQVAGGVTPQVKNQPAGRCLNFLGRVPCSEIRTQYSKADVFVLPSLAEGSAEATYEALAAGLPVITTAAAGSVVRDGVEGKIVPARDPMALANAIEEVIEDRQLRARVSAAARMRAGEYTLERYGERLIAALEGFKP
jgi:glycosyltransferase involved in cell wall biosynthesis